MSVSTRTESCDWSLRGCAYSAVATIAYADKSPIIWPIANAEGRGKRKKRERKKNLN